MKIVHVASEFAPIAKVGGLGEVVTGLARETMRAGLDVEVILPFYSTIDRKRLQNFKKVSGFKSLESQNELGKAVVEECTLFLLETKHPAGYFQRSKIYGEQDDTERFLYFSRAVADFLAMRNEPIDILHLHDWHTSILALFAKKILKLPIGAIFLTLHNVEYQGKCLFSELKAIGIGSSCFAKIEDPLEKDKANLLKAGALYADRAVAVSPTYAKEILTPEFGFHLDSLFKKERSKIRGVLNGLDLSLWGPKNDPYLPRNYEKDSTYAKICEGKMEAKKILERKFNLSSQNRPWIGTICRLAAQKGPSLIEAALRKTVSEKGTFILLGSSSTPEIQEMFDRLKKEFEESPFVHIHFGFDEKLAHQIYAALDFFLMPSIYEPCGLAQMISLLYGTIPIVRATGGLKDTVFDWEDGKVPISKRNGFLFQEAASKELLYTLERAIGLFRKEPGALQTLIQRGVRSDFSWKKPAREYQKLYRELLAQKTSRLQITA